MDRGLWTCLLPYCTPSTAWEWRTAILQPGLNGQWLLLQPNVINAQKITLLGGRLQQRWWRTSAAKGQTALAVADLDGCRSGSAPPPGDGPMPSDRGGSTIGQGQLPLKHCLTNSKHRHIGAKRRDFWPSKYVKMRFWPGLYPGPLTTLPRPSSRLGVGRTPTLPTISHPSILPPSALATRRLRTLIWSGRHYPQIFL